jgi:hypothetical protein
MVSQSGERARAVRLARHYRDTERLSIGEIAVRLGRSQATIREYLYDPDRQKARSLREHYRGVCRGCGAPTSGAGPARARRRCARCNGAASAKWSRKRIERALRAWHARYGQPAGWGDLSLSYARRRGGQRLERLNAGWERGEWPAASVVQYHFGTIGAANEAALGPQQQDAPPPAQGQAL